MINADFCTGSVLISFGAILGKTSPVQLLVMAIFEVTLFALNEFILLTILGVSFFGILFDRKNNIRILGLSNPALIIHFVFFLLVRVRLVL